MKMLMLFTVTLLAGLCSANPTPNCSGKLTVDSEFFDDKFKVYSSKHDIINLVLPLNSLNFKDEINDDLDFSNNEFIIFFTEVDVGTNGEKEYKGLYAFKNGNAVKVLENGHDTAASYGDSKDVYFAAKDGIYKYNAEEHKAEKYGSLDDNFIHIMTEIGEGETTLYAINDKFEMFKITAEGTKKEKLDDVINAQQFVTDFENNIYYYDDKKHVYVINGEGVTRVQGLKADAKYIQLLKPAFLFEDFVPLVLDEEVYLVYSNGSSKLSDFEIKDKPTGYAMEGTLIQYYAFDKKIYEYNILKIVVMGMMEEVKEYFGNHVDTMKEVASRTRSTLRKPKH